MAVAQSFRAIDGIVRSIIIARVLGQDSYAVYAVILAFVGTSQEFCNLSLGTAVIRYGSDYREQNNRERLAPLITASYIVTALSAIVSVIAVTVLLFFAYTTFFDVSGLQLYIIGLAAAVSGIMVDANNKAVLRLFDRFRRSCQIDIIVSMTSVVAFSISIIMFSMDLAAFMWLTIAFSVVSVLMSTLITTWELRRVEERVWTTNVSSIFGEVKAIFALTTLNSFSMTIQRLMRKGDLLLLQVLSTSQAVAIYDVAKKISASVLLLREPLAASAFPHVSRLIANREFGELRKLLIDVYRYLLPTAVIGLAFTALFGSNLMVLCYGAEHEGAGVTIFFLAVVATLYVLFFWGNALVLSLGQFRLQFFAHLFGLAISASAGLLMVPIWGADGMAIASFLGVATIYGIYGALAAKIFRVEPPT